MARRLRRQTSDGRVDERSSLSQSAVSAKYAADARARDRRLVARSAFGSEMLAVPDLVADPAHGLAECAPPHFSRDDLGHFRERGFQGIGMAAAAMRPQQLGQGVAIGHRQRGDAGVVYATAQGATPALSEPQRRCGLATAKGAGNRLTKTETKAALTGSLDAQWLTPPSQYIAGFRHAIYNIS